MTFSDKIKTERKDDVFAFVYFQTIFENHRKYNELKLVINPRWLFWYSGAKTTLIGFFHIVWFTGYFCIFPWHQLRYVRYVRYGDTGNTPNDPSISHNNNINNTIFQRWYVENINSDQFIFKFFFITIFFQFVYFLHSIYFSPLNCI